MQAAGALTRQRQIRTLREAAHRLGVAARNRPGNATAVGLADLLTEIAQAWQSASAEPHSTREDLRWTPVCVIAARIAEEMTK